MAEGLLFVAGAGGSPLLAVVARGWLLVLRPRREARYCDELSRGDDTDAM